MFKIVLVLALLHPIMLQAVANSEQSKLPLCAPEQICEIGVPVDATMQEYKPEKK